MQLPTTAQDAVNVVTAVMTVVTAVAALLHALKLDQKPWAQPFIYLGANLVGLLKLAGKGDGGEKPN